MGRLKEKPQCLSLIEGEKRKKKSLIEDEDLIYTAAGTKKLSGN